MPRNPALTALPPAQIADVLHLRVYGLPQAQGRPRAYRLPSGGVRMYDPARSKDWKRTVMAQVLQARPVDWHLTSRPLTVIMEFWLPRPKSLPCRELWPTKRPDLDNLAKGVLDALQGLIFHDDAQIVGLFLRKAYGDPGVEIWVSEL